MILADEKAGRHTSVPGSRRLFVALICLGLAGCGVDGTGGGAGSIDLTKKAESGGSSEPSSKAGSMRGMGLGNNPPAGKKAGR